MRYLLRGHATIDGACGKSFEVVVESNDSNFKVYSTRQEDAVRAKHPDWKSVVVQSIKEL